MTIYDIVDELTVDELTVDELTVDELTVDDLTCHPIHQKQKST